jgi:hypothetical protein
MEVLITVEGAAGLCSVPSVAAPPSRCVCRGLPGGERRSAAVAADAMLGGILDLERGGDTVGGGEWNRHQMNAEAEVVLYWVFLLRKIWVFLRKLG